MPAFASAASLACCGCGGGGGWKGTVVDLGTGLDCGSPASRGAFAPGTMAFLRNSVILSWYAALSSSTLGFPSLYNLDQYSDQNDTRSRLLTPLPFAPTLPGTCRVPFCPASGGSQGTGYRGPEPISVEADVAVALKRLPRAVRDSPRMPLLLVNEGDGWHLISEM